jgi:hypothetical protein
MRVAVLLITLHPIRLELVPCFTSLVCVRFSTEDGVQSLYRQHGVIRETKTRDGSHSGRDKYKGERWGYGGQTNWLLSSHRQARGYVHFCEV